MQTDEQGFDLWWHNHFIGSAQSEVMDKHFKPLFAECWHAARAFVPRTMAQSREAIREAGGKAWDAIDDVDAAIREIRGEEESE